MSELATDRMVTSQSEAIRVERWRSERSLRWAVVLVSIAVWLMLALSLLGAAYVIALGFFFFLARVTFMTHVRGNGVRLAPDQMPDLYHRVVELSHRLGISAPPAAYVLQSGGHLNALATRFLGADFIVLFSELLAACGDNTQARDMIIAHELGHLKAGHLKHRWFIAPGLAIPLLGTAYSRACEYTSDRYGMAVCADRGAAIRGLTILAAGGREGPRVSLAALARQRQDLNSVWMKIGQWFSTHPPISHRIAALEPALAAGHPSEARARLGATAVLLVMVVVPVLAFHVVRTRVLPEIQKRAEAARAGSTMPPRATPYDRLLHEGGPFRPRLQ
jgi:Zn-dependent protease with chaperone function